MKLSRCSNIKIFLINLDSRKDRLLKMEERLKDTKFERIQAVDKTTLNIKENGNLSTAELSCIASHIKALNRFLESDGEICCILEDDVIFGQDFFKILNMNFVFPDDCYIIKLETFLQDIWVSKFFHKAGSLRLNKLHSIHYGSAAYLTSRKGAKYLISELEKCEAAVDHIFFDLMLDDNRFGAALQLNPACCVQENFDRQHLDSDIYHDRVAFREAQKVEVVSQKFSKNKLVRESQRLIRQARGAFNKALEFFRANPYYKKCVKIKFKG